MRIDFYNLIASLIFGFTILISILYLMLKQKSNENTSLIWIFVAIFGLIQGIFPETLYFVSGLLHINNPPIFLTAATIVFLMGFVFYLSSELSVAQSKINELSMHISLLNNDVLHLRRQTGQDGGIEDDNI